MMDDDIYIIKPPWVKYSFLTDVRDAKTLKTSSWLVRIIITKLVSLLPSNHHLAHPSSTQIIFLKYSLRPKNRNEKRKKVKMAQLWKTSEFEEWMTFLRPTLWKEYLSIHHIISEGH